jgi:hypothetical protein
MSAGSTRSETTDTRAGTGNWHAFHLPLDFVYEAAGHWKETLAGVENPWLCWNVDADWCLLQQKLVRRIGWTPVVGSDPRKPRPPLLPSSVFLDFNQAFKFPVMWMHFPLEFVFLFAKRLAFWHSDLLCRVPVMEKLAEIFSSLEDGQMAAVLDRGGFRNLFRLRTHRYWELCGCTTQGASENQFYNGTGWWRHPKYHPKCIVSSERARRENWFWEHGTGIHYWVKYYSGYVVPIPAKLVAEGHCSIVGNKNFKVVDSNRNSANFTMWADLQANYSLQDVARKLQIEKLYLEGA